MEELVLDTFIPGIVRGQGSNKPLTRRSMRHSDETAEWRNIVVSHLSSCLRESADAARFPLDGPVRLSLVAYMKRPAGHWGTGRNRARLKPSAPRRWQTKFPDLDKIARLVCDAMTIAKLVEDDRQVSMMDCQKVYPAERNDQLGLRLCVYRIEDVLDGESP